MTLEWDLSSLMKSTGSLITFMKFYFIKNDVFKSRKKELEKNTAYPEQNHLCRTLENLCKRVGLTFLWGIRYKTNSTFLFKSQHTASHTSKNNFILLTAVMKTTGVVNIIYSNICLSLFAQQTQMCIASGF